MTNWAWKWSGEPLPKSNSRRSYYQTVIRSDKENEFKSRKFSIGDTVAMKGDDEETWIAHILEFFQVHEGDDAFEHLSLNRNQRCTIRWFYGLPDANERTIRRSDVPDPLPNEVYFSDYVERDGFNEVEVIEGRAWLFSSKTLLKSFAQNPLHDYDPHCDKLRIVRCFVDSNDLPTIPVRRLLQGELEYLLSHPTKKTNLYSSSYQVFADRELPAHPSKKPNMPTQNANSSLPSGSEYTEQDLSDKLSMPKSNLSRLRRRRRSSRVQFPESDNDDMGKEVGTDDDDDDDDDDHIVEEFHESDEDYRENEDISNEEYAAGEEREDDGDDEEINSLGMSGRHGGKREKRHEPFNRLGRRQVKFTQEECEDGSDYEGDIITKTQRRTTFHTDKPQHIQGRRNVTSPSWQSGEKSRRLKDKTMKPRIKSKDKVRRASEGATETLDEAGSDVLNFINDLNTSADLDNSLKRMARSPLEEFVPRSRKKAIHRSRQRPSRPTEHHLVKLRTKALGEKRFETITIDSDNDGLSRKRSEAAEVDPGASSQVRSKMPMADRSSQNYKKRNTFRFAGAQARSNDMGGNSMNEDDDDVPISAFSTGGLRVSSSSPESPVANGVNVDNEASVTSKKTPNINTIREKLAVDKTSEKVPSAISSVSNGPDPTMETKKNSDKSYAVVRENGDMEAGDQQSKLPPIAKSTSDARGLVRRRLGLGGKGGSGVFMPTQKESVVGIHTERWKREQVEESRRAREAASKTSGGSKRKFPSDDDVNSDGNGDLRMSDIQDKDSPTSVIDLDQLRASFAALSTTQRGLFSHNIADIIEKCTARVDAELERASGITLGSDAEDRIAIELAKRVWGDYNKHRVS